MRVYIWGESERYRNYRRAVEAAGGVVQFYGDPEKCGALLLPGGGDLEPWRYGQANTASRGLEPARDTAELETLRRSQHVFRPQRDAADCAADYAQWCRAVARAGAWIENEG